MTTCVRCQTEIRPGFGYDDPVEGWRHADRGLCVTHDREGAYSNRYFPERQAPMSDAEFTDRLNAILDAPHGDDDNNPSAESKITEYRRLG